MKDLCPVCSIREREDVRDRESNMHCIRGRCVRCGMEGHGAKECRNIRNHNDGPCFQCCVGFSEGNLFTWLGRLVPENVELESL